MYSVPEKKEHTDYALETCSKLLEFYNDFFEINYPLKKLGEYTQVVSQKVYTHHFLDLNDLFTHLNISCFRLGSHP